MGGLPRILETFTHGFAITSGSIFSGLVPPQIYACAIKLKCAIANFSSR